MDWKRRLNAYSTDVPSVIWFLARHCLGLPRNRGLFLNFCIKRYVNFHLFLLILRKMVHLNFVFLFKLKDCVIVKSTYIFAFNLNYK